MRDGSGVSRGDRNRNARLARLRVLVPVENAIVGIDLSAVTARTVVVSGDHDVDYFRTTADYLAASIPGAMQVALPWAGNLPTLEAPARMNPLILNWLGPPPS